MLSHKAASVETFLGSSHIGLFYISRFAFLSILLHLLIFYYIELSVMNAELSHNKTLASKTGAEIKVSSVIE